MCDGVQAQICLCVREGRLLTLPACTIVCGDLLYLKAGSRVAADARLVHAIALEVSEAHLTGENVPVNKGTGSQHAGSFAPVN